MLAEALEEIDNATEHLPLARAREKWKAATWYAERREQQRYGGHKVNINIGGSNAPTMSEALAKEASALIAQIGKDE